MKCPRTPALPAFLKYNPIENPNQGKATIKLIDLVPRDSKVFVPLIAALVKIAAAKRARVI